MSETGVFSSVLSLAAALIICNVFILMLLGRGAEVKHGWESLVKGTCYKDMAAQFMYPPHFRPPQQTPLMMDIASTPRTWTRPSCDRLPYRAFAENNVVRPSIANENDYSDIACHTAPQTSPSSAIPGVSALKNVNVFNFA